MTETPENSAGQESSVNSVGRRLCAAREAKGLSRRDVAASLRLPEVTVEALETDDDEGLPAPIFVRGYLRSYAGMLHISADELVELYNERIGEVPAPPLTPLRGPAPGVTGERFLRYTSFAIGLALLVLVLLWVRNEFFASAPADGGPAAPSAVEGPGSSASEGDPEAIAPPPEPAPEPEPESEPESGSESTAGSGPARAPGPGGEAAASGAPSEPVQPPAVQPERPEAGSAPEPQPEAEPEPTGPAAEPAPEAAAETGSGDRSVAPASGTDVLTLEFQGRCWVEVYDANDRRLLFRLAAAGDVRRVTGKAPFRVLLGNADAVQVKINDRVFDTSAYTRGDTARFSVGP